MSAVPPGPLATPLHQPSVQCGCECLTSASSRTGGATTPVPTTGTAKPATTWLRHLEKFNWRSLPCAHGNAGMRGSIPPLGPSWACSEASHLDPPSFRVIVPLLGVWEGVQQVPCWSGSCGSAKAVLEFDGLTQDISSCVVFGTDLPTRGPSPLRLHIKSDPCDAASVCTCSSGDILLVTDVLVLLKTLFLKTLFLKLCSLLSDCWVGGPHSLKHARIPHRMRSDVGYTRRDTVLGV